MDITINFKKLLLKDELKEKENIPFFHKINKEIEKYEEEFNFTRENNQLMKLSIKFNTFSNETRQMLQVIKPKTTQLDFFEGIKYILLKKINELTLKFESTRIKYYKSLPSINIEDIDNISIEKSGKQTKSIYKKFVKKAHEYQKIHQQLNDISQLQKLINTALLDQRDSVYDIIQRKQSIKENINSTSLEIQKGKEERSFLIRMLTIHIYCCCFVLLFVNFYN